MPRHPTAAGRIRRLVTDTGGATLIEYAAITFVVSIALGFALPNFGVAIKGLYEQTSSVLEKLEGIVPNPGNEKSDDGDDHGDDKRDGGKHGKKGVHSRGDGDRDKRGGRHRD